LNSGLACAKRRSAGHTWLGDLMTTTKTSLTAGAKVLLAPLLMVALATSALAVDDPAALAEEALAANPSLEALRARISELDALAGAAGTWSDPVIGIEYSNAPVDSFSLRDHPMSALQLQAQQTIPPWGWSGLREEVAASRTLTSGHALEEAKSQLRREVFELFWRRFGLATRRAQRASISSSGLGC
jgi:hypothetical protein